MSASTRTVQQPQGLGQMVAPFVAVALAILIAAAIAFNPLAAKSTQVAPAAGSAPVFIDHGSRDEIGTWAPAVGAPPVVIDHGSRDEMGTGTSAPTGTSGPNGLRPRPQ
jgi:hypothetical protein